MISRNFSNISCILRSVRLGSVLPNFYFRHFNFVKRRISLSSLRCNNSEQITIGGVVKDISESKNSELVPAKYLHQEPNQTTLRRLRWMLQKDNLNQDMFLIGPPGPDKLRLAYSFAQLIHQEVEYVALSRDTTESDLKQRREIKKGTAIYEDQAAVRAAIHGRLLILDGIEKAERNVLPVLNNLLENREMPLEDGRYLLASSRYDKLLKECNEEELGKGRLVRVHEKFRVIALGLPVPKYVGYPLDPPLRSRFQGLNIGPKTFHEQLLILREMAPNVNEEKLLQLASFAYALNAPESTAQGLPDFPFENLSLAAGLMEMDSDLEVREALSRVYPYSSMLSKDGQKMVDDLFNYLKVKSAKKQGKQKVITLNGTEDYILNTYHNEIVNQLKYSHQLHDFCLVGPRGSGKSTLIKSLAHHLGLDIEPIMLYQDMTARDLLQQRSTLANGDTVWRPSLLLSAIMEGKIAVLDGLHRLNTGTLSSIQSLVHEREAQLFDGSRILREDRYRDIQQRLSLTDEQMAERKLLKAHPDFRIIALAEPPNVTGKTGSHWMSPQVLSMFLYHSLRPLKTEEEINILEKLIFGKLPEQMSKIIQLAQYLRQSTDPTLNNLAGSLTTRQLLRIAKRLQKYPASNVYDLVERACLSKFLPRLPQEALYKTMDKYDIKKESSVVEENRLPCFVKDGELTIGNTVVPLYQGGNQAKIPDVVFYDTYQHVRVLESLLQDYLLGDHLLLIGNQGVGKNRIIDRLLALMNRPREYIQLHRDTTVQSLTVQPNVVNGVVIFQDSPLVRAAKEGNILIVDEADKAPTQVTCILKTLVENGEMLLADGRRILPKGVKSSLPESDIIRLHPDFRMIVLANRPGFPFLGNDFFGALGDLFSVHAIENPSLESELELLRNYGPNVPEQTLKKLVQAFSDLRSMADQGLLSYPYSTREVINIVKHLERFPDDGVVQVVSNVFDFDTYSKEVNDTVKRIFHQHGLPIGASTKSVRLAHEVPLEDPIPAGTWKIAEPVTLSPTMKEILITDPIHIRVEKSSLPAIDDRLLWFTEQKCHWNLPIEEYQFIHDITVKDRIIHVMTTNPAMLFSINADKNELMMTHLDRFVDSSLYGPSNINMRIGNFKDCVVIHDPEIQKILLLNVANKSAQVADINVTSTSFGRLSQKLIGKADNEKVVMGPVISNRKVAVFFHPGSHHLEVVNINEHTQHSWEMNFNIDSIQSIGNENFIVNQLHSNKKYLLNIDTNELRFIGESQPIGHVTSSMLEKPDQSILFTVYGHYGALLKIPDHTLHLWPELNGKESEDITVLPANNVIVRSIPVDNAPQGVSKDNVSGYLEVADLTGKKLRYIPVPKLEYRRRYANSITKSLPWHQTAFDESHVVTVDNHGCVSLWEINASSIAKSLTTWKTSIGDDGSKQLTIERKATGDLSAPKVGKVDPKNAPHVGGNQWAGGTGGRSTAGLGGRGGPYRLDAGHTVYQVSDEDKAAVPLEVRLAARKMGQEAYKERLKQIRMSPMDAELYQKFSSSVQKQVQSLRVILGNVQAKGKERQWVKHQTYGDLDDSKIIEGLTGEKNIYRRRAEREPELGKPLEKPKHLRLLVDCSGSMYRFNGYDGRLEREMAAVLLFMEALEGHSSKWRYDVIGHSGETLNLELVSSERPPQNEKQRLEVLLNMHAHSQFCLAGDHTLEALRQSIASLSQATDIDEAFVILLSDANLERYGIPASHLVHALAATDNVRSAAVFIGSLGDQAARLSQQMPAGSAYVCMDLEKLPHILQQIFTSVLLSN